MQSLGYTEEERRLIRRNICRFSTGNVSRNKDTRDGFMGITIEGGTDWVAMVLNPHKVATSTTYWSPLEQSVQQQVDTGNHITANDFHIIRCGDDNLLIVAPVGAELLSWQVNGRDNQLRPVNLNQDRNGHYVSHYVRRGISKPSGMPLALLPEISERVIRNAVMRKKASG